MIKTVIKTKTTKMILYPETSQGDHDRFKHYVYHPERGRAAAMVTEAMVTGVPVKALCGKLWVPSHNPDRYPICPECKDIKKAAQRGEG